MELSVVGGRMTVKGIIPQSSSVAVNSLPVVAYTEPEAEPVNVPSISASDSDEMLRAMGLIWILRYTSGNLTSWKCESRITQGIPFLIWSKSPASDIMLAWNIICRAQEQREALLRAVPIARPLSSDAGESTFQSAQIEKKIPDWYFLFIIALLSSIYGCGRW